MWEEALEAEVAEALGHEYYEKRHRAGRGSHSVADRAPPFVRRVDAGLVGRPKAGRLFVRLASGRTN